ncbi:MAG: hypothetical protein ACLFSX_06685, partial [Candidatus Acetothermia bacterium]
MQKTKLALVSLLSLLIVVTPVASALAETSNEQDPIRQEKEAEDEPDSNEARGEVFGEIEKEGG